MIKTTKVTLEILYCDETCDPRSWAWETLLDCAPGQYEGRDVYVDGSAFEAGWE
jgi:hypothetical protein